MPKLKDDLKKQRIIESAISTISENGFFKSTISTIAKKADVADGTIYTYFKNKEELLIEAFEYVLDSILEKINIKLKKESDLFEQIRIIISEHIEFMEQNPDTANFLQIQLRQSTKNIRLNIKNAMRKYYTIIGKILKEATEKGLIRNDVDYKIIGHMIFGTVDEIVTSWVLSEKKSELTDKTNDIYKLIISAIKSQDYICEE